MRMFARAAMIAAGALLVTSAAQAQATESPFTFGVKAGAAIPTGDFGDNAGTGWYLGGVLGFLPAAFPVQFQFDLGYTGFGEQSVSAFNSTVTSSTSMITGTANVVVPFGREMTRPFATGGVGIYNLRGEVSCSGAFCDGGFRGNDSETKAGINLGGGVNFQLAGLQSVVEARYNHIFNAMVDDYDGSFTSNHGENRSAAQFISLTFGLMFR